MVAKDPHPEDHIVNLIVQHQRDLKHYILSLLPDAALAADVLQETNLVLWNKADEYDRGRPFLPWALTIAWFQVKAARRDSARDIHVFDDDLLETLAAESEIPDGELMEKALEHCLGKLSAPQRKLILARYQPGASVQEMAADFSQTPNALSLGLLRIRNALKSCIEQQLNLSST
ncbi:sigma-70 family RNA polymerase sigma factor [Luteolibacter algae]|uniref:Sigma-70 family RNA polymerase sigma factor n=1 Tax=Luteolibacter algae TaxID=454151 RepID=A0ABW5D688_9BACT